MPLLKDQVQAAGCRVFFLTENEPSLVQQFSSDHGRPQLDCFSGTSKRCHMSVERWIITRPQASIFLSGENLRTGF